MKKRTCAYVILIALLLAACAPATQATPPPPPPTEGIAASTVPDAAPASLDVRDFVWLTEYSSYGNARNRAELDLVIDALNLQLERDMRLKLVVEEWDWQTQDFARVSLTAEDHRYDMINMATARGFYRFAAEGLLTDLRPALEQYPALGNVIGEDNWKSVTVLGGIYAIPMDSGGSESGTYVQLRKEDAPPFFDTPSELLDFCMAVHDKDGSMLADAGGTPAAIVPRFLHRAYEGWPFLVDDTGLFLFDANGNVSGYFDSEVFSQDAGWMKTFRDAGILSSTERNSVRMGALGVYDRIVYSARDNYDFHYLAPGKGQMNFSNRQTHTVPATADPELAVRLMNWFYEDPTRFDLLAYGIEGTHYSLDTEGVPQRIVGSDGNALYSLGGYFDWQQSLALPRGDDKPMPKTDLERVLMEAPMYSLPCFGFVFDPEPVQTAYDAVMSSAALREMNGIRDGFTPMTEHGRVLADLKRAGLDAVIEEARRQYEAFKEMVGW